MKEKHFTSGGKQLNIVQNKIHFSLALIGKKKKNHTGVAMKYSLFPFIIHY